jgi:fructose-bisphosphate aldolase class I
MPANFSQEIAKELSENARKIATPGKGILAADESTGTIKKRFDSIGVENTEENRAAYRELLFTTKGVGQYVSGAILYEETLFQSAGGKKQVEHLAHEHIIPGIKVDMGLVHLPGTDAEKSTQGLDGLDKRCQKYYAAGARFAKWRAVLEIDEAKNKPSHLSIQETAHTLARYAAICQENRLVPIVEPEILTDGAHTIQHCAKVTEQVLAAVFKALSDHHVLLEGALLKPNMVTQGAQCPHKATPEEVAFYTVRTLRRTVPPALVGVMFLSGGQSEEDASLNLNAMNAMKEPHPWILSFSYGRALQASVLAAWKGKTENIDAAKNALMERAKANGEAQLGKYKGGVASAGSLYEKGYVY